MASEAALHIADNWAAGDPLLADEVAAAIQAAVQAEREACAAIADSAEQRTRSRIGARTYRAIATAIRYRTKEADNDQ